MQRFAITFALLCALSVSFISFAAAEEDAAKTAAAKKERIEQLTKLLNGCRFVGKFTVQGKEGTQTEEYIISKAEKQPEGDKWLLVTRIKYGKTDLEVPLVMDIKWLESTPIISLDNFGIPGMGSFGARVVIHDKKYAGTWQHDAVGGHLYGNIEPLEKTSDKKEPEKKDSEKK